MIWSISESKTFKRCQRQWYFKNCVANALAKKDPVRREAYLLGKLQTISGWRGQIVDTILSEVVVPALNRKSTVTLTQAKIAARDLFNTQLECAKRHPLRDAGLSPSKLGNSFAVFHCMEYDKAIPANEIEQAWSEIDRALTNLYHMDSLRTRLKQASYLVAQRALIFNHTGVSVRAVPDLIAFFRDAPPLIVDWKVHFFGTQEAWRQLCTYAIALKRCNPHKDFPADLARWKEEEIRLTEAQLLTNQIRDFALDQNDIDNVDTYIADSVTQMLLATGGTDADELNAQDFPTTTYAENCKRCSYRVLCWEPTQ